jgi:hypothetical protein
VTSFLDALRAYGPAAGEAERLMLFGQFVGAWTAGERSLARPAC